MGKAGVFAGFIALLIGIVMLAFGFNSFSKGSEQLGVIGILLGFVIFICGLLTVYWAEKD